MSVRRIFSVLLTALRRALRRGKRIRRELRDRRGDGIAMLTAQRLPERGQRVISRQVLARSYERTPSHVLRAALSGALPADPLHGAVPSAIDVIVPCHRRDFDVLPWTVNGARHAVGSQLRQFLLVVPDRDLDAASALCDLLAAEGGAVRPEVVAESTVLPGALRAMVEQVVPARRHGWVIQQLLKIMVAAQSGRTASLLLDADTVLLRQRTWASSDGRQLLLPVHEFHEPYDHHFVTMWPEVRPVSRVSYVSHHQVMQRDVLEGMFGEDTAGGLERWVRMGDWSEDVPISEYHSYGTWLSSRYPQRSALGAFRNVRSGRAVILASNGGFRDPVDSLQRMFPGALSVSLHAYLG